MYLCLLLLLPVLIGVAGLVFSKGLLNIKEFVIMELAVLAVVSIGYVAARHSKTIDLELWNGQVRAKKRETVSCSHSYQCNCHESCSGSGSGRSCTTICQTCYEHLYDYAWNLYTSAGETITIDPIDRQGVNEPRRFTDAKIGDPTAVSHLFRNYIKANPSTVLRRHGMVAKYSGLIPAYPIDVYDYHYCDRLVTAGVNLPDEDRKAWNRALMEINGRLGPKVEVNIVVVMVNTNDQSYVYALEEAWIGGKKNDLIVVMGVTNYPNVDWVDVTSWSRAERLKIELRDRLLDVKGLGHKQDMWATIEHLVSQQYLRPHMKDYKWLMASVQPGTGVTITLFLLGLGLTIGLLIYFIRNDPFQSRYGYR